MFATHRKWTNSLQLGSTHFIAAPIQPVPHSGIMKLRQWRKDACYLSKTILHYTVLYGRILSHYFHYQYIMKPWPGACIDVRTSPTTMLMYDGWWSVTCSSRILKSLVAELFFFFSTLFSLTTKKKVIYPYNCPIVRAIQRVKFFSGRVSMMRKDDVTPSWYQLIS